MKTRSTRVKQREGEVLRVSSYSGADLDSGDSTLNGYVKRLEGGSSASLRSLDIDKGGKAPQKLTQSRKTSSKGRQSGISRWEKTKRNFMLEFIRGNSSIRPPRPMVSSNKHSSQRQPFREFSVRGPQSHYRLPDKRNQLGRSIRISTGVSSKKVKSQRVNTQVVQSKAVVVNPVGLRVKKKKHPKGLKLSKLHSKSSKNLKIGEDDNILKYNGFYFGRRSKKTSYLHEKDLEMIRLEDFSENSELIKKPAEKAENELDLRKLATPSLEVRKILTAMSNRKQNFINRFWFQQDRKKSAAAMLQNLEKNGRSWQANYQTDKSQGKRKLGGRHYGSFQGLMVTENQTNKLYIKPHLVRKEFLSTKGEKKRPRNNFREFYKKLKNSEDPSSCRIRAVSKSKHSSKRWLGRAEKRGSQASGSVKGVVGAGGRGYKGGEGRRMHRGEVRYAFAISRKGNRGKDRCVGKFFKATKIDSQT